MGWGSKLRQDGTSPPARAPGCCPQGTNIISPRELDELLGVQHLLGLKGLTAAAGTQVSPRILSCIPHPMHPPPGDPGNQTWTWAHGEEGGGFQEGSGLCVLRIQAAGHSATQMPQALLQPISMLSLSAQPFRDPPLGQTGRHAGLQGGQMGTGGG
ncbi:unnamed protein product [Rangifer tarandus platyrhynchus]|uniref:Uncharacterized protein n=1 Tax=Rangifer tarandus platyrhynchus TaxID=3082113 RepID=A0AC59Z3G1_RANTA